MTVTAGQAEYRLPSRALGARFKSVGWQQTGDNRYTRLRHLPADAYYLQSSTEQGAPNGFFMRDNTLVLVPTPNAAGLLRVPYYLRPNTLGLPADVSQIVTSVDTGTWQVGVVDGSFFGPSAVVDVIRGEPGFETLIYSAPVMVAGDTLTFTVEFPMQIAADDYVCFRGYSPVAQCPVEVRGLLAVRAARRALKSVNEGQLASMLDADVDELTAVARGLLAPRADAEQQEWGDVTRGLLYGVV